MKRWLVRLVVVLAIVEIAYLVAVNVMLNLPATQAYINQINPEKSRFQWDRAWSWIPFRIHATNFTGNFQSWSQQWQISVPEVSASLAIAPLLWKTVHLYAMDGDNIDLRFRRRPSPDRNDADVRQFFPTIPGRDPNLPAGPTPTPEPGWKLVLEIARIGGDNNIWIQGMKATLAGEARATITHQGRYGPLAFEDGEGNLTVKALSIDGKQVADSGTIKGTFGVAPNIPYQNRGLKALPFISVNAEIDVPIDSLDFLNTYLSKSTGMSLGGTGALKGRIVYDKGSLLAGTDLAISADGLTAAQLPYLVDGSGEVAVTVTAETPKFLTAAFRFKNLNIVDKTDDLAVLTGKDLQLTVERSANVLPGEDEFPKRVALDIPTLTIADLNAYQRYLPTKWQVQLLGGSGSLQGKAELSATKLLVDLVLRSEDAHLKFKDESFETNLELALKATGKVSNSTAAVDVSGSNLVLDDSRIKLKSGSPSDSWQAQLAVSTGEADFNLPKSADGGPAGFWKLARDRSVRSLLTTLDGKFKAALAISDLNWANALIKSPFALAFDSSAKIDTDLTIRSGFLAQGSKLAMRPQKFTLGVLDYVAEGSGGFDLTVEKGGEEPDLGISANLTNASFRQQDETQAVIDEMTLGVRASATGVSLKDGGDVTAVDLDIPSAKVTDMSAYNAYLPKGSPLRILNGKADLAAKVNMQKSTAGGFVKLKTSRIDADLDGQRISGTIGVDVKINGGSAQDKTFDITGSSLAVDGVHLAGQASGGQDWSGRIDFGRSRVVWAKQAKLDASASVRMTDTRPLVQYFQASRKGHEWLDRILTLRDVRGNATIKVDPNEFVVPYALAKSDTIELGAKGIFSDNNRQGLYYARYGALAAILAFDNGKRHFALLGATKKFEDYVPGGKLPGLDDGPSSRPSETGRKRNGPLSIFRRK